MFTVTKAAEEKILQRMHEEGKGGRAPYVYASPAGRRMSFSIVLK